METKALFVFYINIFVASAELQPIFGKASRFKSSTKKDLSAGSYDKHRYWETNIAGAARKIPSALHVYLKYTVCIINIY